ncbi:hypothetical protein CFOL_v3_27263 [Cephalotus follicularis]|uniref:Uncharacterized protein n=1 Tax=Cephalotus follicularis TaxID=3775 RepID=A0A1Q3CUT8_CEPFO|nr:hypothetical protein CFOL_v3_27263 [Cephalotus follicularis]
MDSSSNPKKHQQHHHQPSSSELLQSAELVAEAARSTFSHDNDKLDKAKIAGAAENLLSAAAHYGKCHGSNLGHQFFAVMALSSHLVSATLCNAPSRKEANCTHTHCLA